MVTEESFGLFAFYRDEASYEVVGDGCQQDEQEDNLSLKHRETERHGELRYTWREPLTVNLIEQMHRSHSADITCSHFTKCHFTHLIVFYQEVWTTQEVRRIEFQCDFDTSTCLLAGKRAACFLPTSMAAVRGCDVN